MIVFMCASMDWKWFGDHAGHQELCRWQSEGIHPYFEIQGRHHQKSKTEPNKKDCCPPKNLEKQWTDLNETLIESILVMSFSGGSRKMKQERGMHYSTKDVDDEVVSYFIVS